MLWGKEGRRLLRGIGLKTLNEISMMTTHLECLELGIIQTKLFLKLGTRLMAKRDTVQRFHKLRGMFPHSAPILLLFLYFFKITVLPASAAQKLQKKVNNESIVLLKANFFMSHCLCNVLQQAIAKEMLGIYIRQVSIVPCSPKCTDPVYWSSLLIILNGILQQQIDLLGRLPSVSF